MFQSLFNLVTLILSLQSFELLASLASAQDFKLSWSHVDCYILQYIHCTTYLSYSAQDAISSIATKVGTTAAKVKTLTLMCTETWRLLEHTPLTLALRL